MKIARGSLALVFCLLATAVAIPGHQRDGRIFDPNFWDGFGRDLTRTAGHALEHLADNLETSMDQLNAAFNPNSQNFADRIEQQVSDSLPIWMRSPQNDNEPIEALIGDFDGVDDGLQVYYEGNEKDLSGFPEGHRVATSAVEDVDWVGPSSVPGSTVNRPGVSDYDDFFDFGFGGSLFNTFNPFLSRRRPFVPQHQPWWRGQNVCLDTEEVDEAEDDNDETDESGTQIVSSDGMRNSAKFHFSLNSFQMKMQHCTETSDKYICTVMTKKRGINKTVKEIYRCCHGFVRIPGEGCTKVDLRTLPDTLESIGATKFLSLVKSSGVIDVLEKGNMTIFVPTNEAVEEFTVDLEEENEIANRLEPGLEIDDGLLDGPMLVDGERSANEVFRRRRSVDGMDSAIRSHITSGFLYAGDLQDEQVLKSEEEGSTLRINTYNGYPRIVTVNCARMVTVNQHATDGVVHTIDRVLKPVTKTLADIISSDRQFSILKKLVKKAGLFTMLAEDGQLTIFAPTNTAFRSLPKATLKSLQEGSACLDAVLNNHILPNVICSAAVEGKARTVNLLENFLLMEKDEDGKMFVKDAQVVVKDIMATNGVLHIIDAPLLPHEAMPVLDVLKKENLTEFLNMLEKAELTEELAGLANITLFAPSNEAIRDLPKEVVTQLMNDTDYLREILRYHMTIEELTGRDIENNHIIDTRANHPLRINLYTRSPLLSGVLSMARRSPMRVTAGCSRVSVMDARACGAVVHVVERILDIPQESVMHQLNGSEDFSIFTRMIRDVGLEDTLTDEGAFTVLAPSDHVFKTLPAAELKQLLEDDTLKEQLVKKHILEEHVCCSGINTNQWLFMDHKRTMDGSSLHIRRTHNGRLMAGPARITHCSSPSHNGLVHTVNNLLLDIRPQSPQISLGPSRRRGTLPQDWNLFMHF